MRFHDHSIPFPLAAATVAIFAWCAWPHAGRAQPVNSLPDGPIDCAAFHRSADGSWTVLRAAAIHPRGASLNLASGQTFAPNQMVQGFEITAILDRNCGNK